MSSAVVSTSAARGRLFVFDDEEVPEVCSLSSTPSRVLAEGRKSAIARLQSTIKNQQSKIPPAGVTPASHLEVRPAPEMVSSGIAALDVLAGGLPRGCLTEICGPASSGRTTLLLAALAAATRRGEFCTIVDASDALDPHSVVAAGVELERLLWVRCGEDPPRKIRGTERKKFKGNQASKFDEAGSRPAEHRLEQLLRTADLLLESGGFGLVALDLSDLPLQAVRCIPLATWFRFRRVVEHTPTVLLTLEQQPIAGSCSSLVVKLGAAITQPLWKFAAQTTASFAEPAHAQLFTGLEITAELVCSRLDRKPVRSAAITFVSTTAWAG